MIRVLIIPDVHGTTEWKRAINMIDNYDYIIALGDWFDSHENKWGEVNQVENLKEFIDFQEKYPDKVFSCLGNHDFHYLFANYGERYSGFQSYKSWDIREFLEENIDKFNLAVMIDGVVFSHAGITKAWMERYGYKTFADMNFDIINQDITMRGDRFSELSFTRNSGAACDMFGNEPSHSPIWVRPEALWGISGENMFFKHQVVGHTCYKDEYAPHLKFNAETGRELLCCDNANHYLIDLSIINGEFGLFNKVVGE